MGARDQELIQTTGFPMGVNNTAPEHALPRSETGTAQFLREAINADLDAEGKARRRPGFAEVIAGDMHSGWSDDHFPFALVVRDHTLCVVHDDLSYDPLVSGLAPGLPVSYARINDAVSWTNGVQSGQVTAELETRPWCCPTPGGVPAVALGEGGLDAGSYQVAVTFVDAWGRESGAALAAAIDAPANSSILISQIPQPPDGGRVRIYATSGNDGVLRGAAAVTAGVTEFILSQPATGITCKTFGLRTMPAGQLVAYGNGRQYVARNSELLFSPSLRYGMLAPARNRVSFAGRISMIAYVGEGTGSAGLYVSDSKRTYWLEGADPAEWRQVIASPSAALPGQIAMAPGDVWGLDTTQPLPVWQSVNGRLVVGLPGGKLFQPQPRPGAAPDVVFDAADRAALMYREGAGDRRVVSALKSAGAQSFAMRDQLTVREYPHT